MKRRIPKEIQFIIAAFKQQLQAIIAHKLERIILFGSYARSEQEKASDIDLLILLKQKLTKREWRLIARQLSEISLKNDVVISGIPYDAEDFFRKNTPFLINVKKEGINV